MLISEELFLLLRRDDGKAESAFSQNAYGLNAAVITDLVLAERVTLSHDKDPRLSLLSPAPTGHPALDTALARLAQREGKKLSSLVTDGKLAVEPNVAFSLQAAGVIVIEEKKVLGLVPAKYPVRDPGPERRVRERLRAVLAGATPQVEDSTLLSILQGLGLAPHVLAAEKGTMGERELKQRIEQISTEVPAGEAVRKAVQAMNAAIVTAVFIPTITAGGAAGS